MANVTTDFIKVAQAGPSVDGRIIREEWIRDMAESYAPATYTAMLWPEHVRWNGNLGEVLELKAGHDDQGLYSLFARLQPNKWLLDYNAEGQGLFYSIEVAENFADSGKAYLVGLGVTDSPASLGLPSTRFTAHQGTQCLGNVPFSALTPSKGPGQSQDEPPGWFKRLLPSLFTSDSGETSPQAKDAPMEELESRIAALEDGFTALTEQLAHLDGRLTALEVDVAAGEGGEGTSGDPAYKALARQIGKFRQEMGAFTKQMSATVKPGTQAPKNSGAARGKGIL